jgi:hypothetical protein
MTDELEKVGLKLLQRKEEVYFCPQCGSPSLELPTLGGGTAKCNACQWEGPSKHLLVTQIRHELGDTEQLIEKFMTELRVNLAKHCAKIFGTLLHRWGFLGTEMRDGEEILSTKQLSRYMAAIAHASLLAIIRVREEIEETKADESRN